jgi:hypothetical protein
MPFWEDFSCSDQIPASLAKVWHSTAGIQQR